MALFKAFIPTGVLDSQERSTADRWVDSESPSQEPSTTAGRRCEGGFGR